MLKQQECYNKSSPSSKPLDFNCPCESASILPPHACQSVPSMQALFLFQQCPLSNSWASSSGSEFPASQYLEPDLPVPPMPFGGTTRSLKIHRSDFDELLARLPSMDYTEDPTKAQSLHCTDAQHRARLIG